MSAAEPPGADLRAPVVAGFWMSSPTTLSYQVESKGGDRVTLAVEFVSAEEVHARCAEVVRTVVGVVRAEGLVSSRKARYLNACSGMIAGWILDHVGL